MLENLLKDIPENIRVIITNSLPLAIVIILFLFVGNFGVSKITSMGDQVAQATKSNNILTQKVNTLQAVGSIYGNAPDMATTALPSSDSALTAISQIKTLSFLQSLTLSNIKAGTETLDLTGLSRVDISLEAVGSKAQIVAFVKSISGIAPITTVESIKLNESAGSSHATISLRTYWSPLPKTLPAVDQAISDLTPDERATLLTIGKLTQPSFLTLPPASGGGKADPFSI